MGGEFTEVSGLGANNIAAWDGGNWSILGSGLNGPCKALADDGIDTFVGGDFSQAGDKVSNFVGLREGDGTVSTPLPRLGPPRSRSSAARAHRLPQLRIRPWPVHTAASHSCCRRDAVVRVDIIDLAGRRVLTLAQQRFTAGRHSLDWDGRDASGRVLPAGLYLARLETDGTQLARKLTRVR